MSSKVTKARPAAVVDTSPSPLPARPSFLNMFTALLSPPKRNRVEPVPTPQKAPSSNKSRQGSNKSNNTMVSRRKSLTNMLGGDVAFQNFTSVAQKVFSVPLAVVVHVNPTSTAGGGGGAGGAGGMRTVASKGGAIDRIKFDGVKRDANSRFYAIFPEGFDVVVIDDCTKVCHTSGILRPLTEPLRSAVPSPCCRAPIAAPTRPSPRSRPSRPTWAAGWRGRPRSRRSRRWRGPKWGWGRSGGGRSRTLIRIKQKERHHAQEEV